MRGLARANETSLWQAAKDGIASGELGGRMATVLRYFIEEIDTMSETVQGAELDEIAVTASMPAASWSTTEKSRESGGWRARKTWRSW